MVSYEMAQFVPVVAGAAAKPATNAAKAAPSAGVAAPALARATDAKSRATALLVGADAAALDNVGRTKILGG